MFRAIPWSVGFLLFGFFARSSRKMASSASTCAGVRIIECRFGCGLVMFISPFASIMICIANNETIITFKGNIVEKTGSDCLFFVLKHM